MRSGGIIKDHPSISVQMRSDDLCSTDKICICINFYPLMGHDDECKTPDTTNTLVEEEAFPEKGGFYRSRYRHHLNDGRLKFQILASTKSTSSAYIYIYWNRLDI